MLNATDFSKRLDKILDFYGLTASALAEEIDFNRSTISHLVSGRNKPSLDFVMKLLQKFPELDMDWLVLGKGTFPADTKSKSIENITNSPTASTKPSKVFSESSNESKTINEIKSNQQNIERIVLFFKDGSFKVYEN